MGSSFPFQHPEGAGNSGLDGNYHVLFLPNTFGGPRHFVMKKNVGTDFDYWHVLAEAPSKYEAQRIAEALAERDK